MSTKNEDPDPKRVINESSKKLLKLFGESAQASVERIQYVTFKDPVVNDGYDYNEPLMGDMSFDDIPMEAFPINGINME